MTIDIIYNSLKQLREFTAHTIQPWTNKNTGNVIYSLQQPSLYIKTLLKRGLISPIPVPDFENLKRCYKFYTAQDTKTIDPREMKHHFMQADVAMAFSLLYPSSFLKFSDKIPYKNAKGERGMLICDFSVNINGRMFYVEIERSNTPFQIFKEKIFKKYDRILNDNCRVLFICAPRTWKFDLRPMEFGKEENQKMVADAERAAQILSKNFTKHYYRSLPISDFHRLDEKVWYAPGGEKDYLIK